MKCASALSTARQTAAAGAEVLDRVTADLGDAPADLALAFVSPDHAEGLATLAAEVRRRKLARHVLGCTGEAIVGPGREVEGAPAVSLWAIRFPSGVAVRPIRLTFDGSDFGGWPEGLADLAADRRALVLLGDPFSFPTDRWLRRLADEAPGLRVIGGMASGGQAPGVNRLVLDDQVFDDGAVATLIEGPLALRTVVSQGCRPIGRPLIVTRADRNLIQELGRRPALQVLQEIFEGLDEADRDLVRRGLHIGRVINEYQDSFRSGDFLVRNVMGADDEGGIAITDVVRVGQTVQFHVRDAGTADEDLRALLADARQGGVHVAGALLFTCNGRGSRLFPEPDHDAAAVAEAFGPIPVAGLFAMGEIGPVGGQNFVHGFTASLALFEDQAEPTP